MTNERLREISGLTTRRFSEADTDAVLVLVNADRLPGQPEATAQMLGEAVAGRSPIDGGWWDELAHPVAVDVVEDDIRDIVGVVSYATRPKDQAGLILWLHGREDPKVVGGLVDHALARLDTASDVHAYAFATALGLGLEALPVRHRPNTAAALRERGFEALDLWRYMRRGLPAHGQARAESVKVERPEDADRESRRLTVRDGGRLIADAEVGVPVAGIGVLWWISVERDQRGHGLGRALLGSALEVLERLGASEVILYVDDDEHGGERDRTAAIRLYESVGFTEVDRLRSYRLRIARR